MNDEQWGPGWWQATDGLWYPPEAHPGYSPPQPFGWEPDLPHQGRSFTPNRNRNRWVAAGIAGAVIIALVVGVVVSSSGRGKSGGRGSPAAASDATNSLAQAAAQWTPDEVAYGNVSKTQTAAVAFAAADILKQNERIQSDQTRYANDLGGSGCNPADYENYLSCLSQDQQAGANALSDENAAQAAAKADEAQEITAISAEQGAISTYVLQLDGIRWPTAQSRQDASSLAQDLTNYRADLSQTSTDLSDNVSIVADKDALTTDQSDISTQVINLSTALGIPVPSAAASS